MNEVRAKAVECKEAAQEMKERLQAALAEQSPLNEQLKQVRYLEALERGNCEPPG